MMILNKIKVNVVLPVISLDGPVSCQCQCWSGRDVLRCNLSKHSLLSLSLWAEWIIFCSGRVWCGVVCGVGLCAPGWSRSLKKKSPAWCVVVQQQYRATLHHQDTVWRGNSQDISHQISQLSTIIITRLSAQWLLPVLRKQGRGGGLGGPGAGLIWNGITVRKPFRSYLAVTAEVTANWATFPSHPENNSSQSLLQWFFNKKIVPSSKVST